MEITIFNTTQHEKCEGTGIIISKNGDKEFCTCPKGKLLEKDSDA